MAPATRGRAPVPVGRVAELWRFPVKSMQGERVERVQLIPRGVVGDRDWALTDDASGEVTSAKRLPALLGFAARHTAAPTVDGPNPVEIRLPDGASFASVDEAAASAAISEALGHPVTLSARRPARDRAHYRKRHRAGAADTRAVLGLEPDEPFPDLSSLPLRTLLDLVRYSTPPGTYVDACPLHLLTTASLAHMGALAPGARFDVRRFRPNLLVETEPDLVGLPEEAWVGAQLLVGDAAIRILSRTVRCSMPAREQPGLDRAPEVARTVSRANGRHLGVYAEVDRAGAISVGDELLLVPDERAALTIAAARVGTSLRRAALGVARRVLR